MAQETQREYAPDEVNEDGEYIKIGGSPLPGITLRAILRGHTDTINRMAWSPDGQYLASPSDDNTIRIWNVEPEVCIAVLEGHEGSVYSVDWSPDGQKVASASSDNTVKIWDVNKLLTKKHRKPQTLFGHVSFIRDVRWSNDGQKIATGSGDCTVRVWDAVSGKLLKTLEEPDRGEDYWISCVEWAPDDLHLAYGDDSGVITIRDVNQWTTFRTLKGHTNYVISLAWSPDGQMITSGSSDKTIRLWDIKTGQQTIMLEGHTNRVKNISYSPNGNILASHAEDNTVRLWRTDTWQEVTRFKELTTDALISSLTFHPHHNRLATLGNEDTVIRIWDIEVDVLLGQVSIDSVRYTTAKLVLVGDSGVGKTGLGWRLAHDEFKEHSSTHGQQFWVIPELGKQREDGTECEAVLWDLAGQPDYRLVHSLFLDDVDTALVLFDPTNRQEPLSGVDFWLNQLKQGNKDLCNTILVGARTDRGTSTLTKDELIAYCERKGICGGYIPTSAKDGDGLEELLDTLKEQIPWEEMTATVTTVTFKRIKEFVLELKEQIERKNVLVHPDELRTQLEATDEEWKFSDAEMITAVGHLANHGYVTILRGSKGEQSILLAPDLLANLASSIVLEARRNPHGLGVLDESRLLAGDYKFLELHDLEADEREILLDAAAVLFLEHNLCFRETFNQQTFLVFPSLINEKRPKDEDITPVEGASYHVKGAVENVYASLVVLLGYTNTFVRINQWQNQAQYVLGEGEICGFQQSDYHAGEIELVLYYDEKTPESTKLLFRGMFERFLSRHDLEIARYQAVFCPKCGSQLARTVVLSQLAKDKDFSFCNECGTKLSLPSPEPLTRLSRREEVELDVQQGIAQRRTAFEAALVRVKALLREREEEKSPTCFISYAWGSDEHQRWVLQLAKDLRNSGIVVLLDRWNVVPGANLDRYIEQIMETDFVVVGSPGLLQKYNSKTSDPVVTAELEMVNLRLRQANKYGHTILPILVDGDADTALTPQMQKLVYVDFKQSAFYFRQLFDMIWRLYDFPFDNPLLEELRASMSPQER